MKSLFTDQQDEDPDQIHLNIHEKNQKKLTERETKVKIALRKKRIVINPGAVAKKDVKRKNPSGKCKCIQRAPKFNLYIRY